MRLADEIVVIAILRAGLGMTDGALRLIPEARVGHLGLYRDEESLQPVGYYESIPPHADGRRGRRRRPDAGHRRLGRARARAAQARRAPGGCASSASSPRPRGSRRCRRRIPTCPIWCAAVDRELDERGYIRPGLGDAGDRIFGTE